MILPADSHRTIYLLRQAAFAILSVVDSYGQDVGVTLAQYTILSFLKRSVDMTAADLARRLKISPQSVNEIVSALQAHGFVTKESVSNNRKSLRLVMTPAGARHLQLAETAIDRAEEHLFADLSPKMREDLRSALRSVIDRGNMLPLR